MERISSNPQETINTSGEAPPPLERDWEASVEFFSRELAERPVCILSDTFHDRIYSFFHAYIAASATGKSNVSPSVDAAIHQLHDMVESARQRPDIVEIFFMGIYAPNPTRINRRSTWLREARSLHHRITDTNLATLFQCLVLDPQQTALEQEVVAFSSAFLTAIAVMRPNDQERGMRSSLRRYEYFPPSPSSLTNRVLRATLHEAPSTFGRGFALMYFSEDPSTHDRRHAN